MAYTQPMSPQSPHQHYDHPLGPTQQRRYTKQRFVNDLSQCLFDFVIQLLPTAEEMAVKEDVRKLLERLIRTIEPDSRLLSFGSTANGFSLRNSDMDLCCLIDSDERLSATDLVTMLGNLLERETKFHVKPLPHARIPIVKLSLDPSPGLPLGIACDIGFENRLALENTRLLMCYAMIDPTRVRTMVLFLKVWSKRRKINSPYKGTLSSYGYVLLVLYFLIHVKNPPVLPNLQSIPPLRPITKEETHLGGYNTWFFDDIELLRQRWHSENTETVAELLIDFFRYYSRDFLYNTGVASIRAGLLKKDSKGWQNDLSGGRFNDPRERNRLCIEDPFETDYNVSRCVTKDGLYMIRGEFMRASRVLSTRPDRAIIALAELCEERKDEASPSPPPYVPPRLVTPHALPPQTPYTVGSQPMRPKVTLVPDNPSPPTQFFEPGPRLAVHSVSVGMEPKRGKWTSPPPPEAPSADHTLFENSFGKGLEMATAATEARETEPTDNSSSNSECLTDEDAGESDDVRSVQSFTEGSTTSSPSGSYRRPAWLHPQDSAVRTIPAYSSFNTGDIHARLLSGSRGRVSPRNHENGNQTPVAIPPRYLNEPLSSSSRHDISRRSFSGPPRRYKGLPKSPNTPTPLTTPLPPSPDPSLDPNSATVFYQTTVTRSPRPNILYPSTGSHTSFLSQYQHQHPANQAGTTPTPQDIFLENQPPSLMNSARGVALAESSTTAGRSSRGPETPTPMSYSYSQSSHSHSHSSSTITALTPPPHTSRFSQSQPQPQPQSVIHSSPLISGSPSPPSIPIGQHFLHQNKNNGSISPRASSTSNGSSPTPSSTGYATSLSRSPSPSPPPTSKLALAGGNHASSSPVVSKFGSLSLSMPTSESTLEDETKVIDEKTLRNQTHDKFENIMALQA